MSNYSGPAGDGPHGYRPLPTAEALAREMARREWAARPDSIAWEQLQKKAAKRQRPAEMIGPPNPFRIKLRPGQG